jgi:hypothetical protein
MEKYILEILILKIIIKIRHFLEKAQDLYKFVFNKMMIRALKIDFA